MTDAAAPSRLYFRQLLAGRDIAQNDPLARQMVNFVYLIGDRETGEAVVIDPKRGHAYLTEDASGPNGLLYRWVPPHGFTHGRGKLRTLADEASTGLRRGWSDAVRATTRRSGEGLSDALDRAVATTDLDVDRHRRWWSAVRVLQWVLVAGVLVGLGWLGAAFLLAYLRLPPLPDVLWWGFPAPTVLVVGGVLAGLLSQAIGSPA